MKIFFGEFNGPAELTFLGGRVRHKICGLYGIAFRQTFIGVIRTNKTEGVVLKPAYVSPLGIDA